MNATITPATAKKALLKRRPASRPALVLVATDGSGNSRAAYMAADLIARQRGARVHVLSVVEPLPAIVPPPGTPIVSPGVDREREDALRTDMVEQLLKLGRLAEWTTEIRAGKAPTVIAEVAKDRHVDLIVIGSSHHGVVDRLLGGETAANLARIVDRPILIAPPVFGHLPERVIIAFELGQIDRAALVRGLDILGSPVSLSVVHVEPQSMALGVDWAEFDSEYRSEVEAAYDKVNEALGALPRIQAELVVLHGDVAREIAQLAESVKAEMIVLGVKPRKPGSLARGGGIAMKITRAVRCPVLLIPRPD